MSRVIQRIVIVVIVIGAVVAYTLWHTSGTWQYEEVDPGVFYRCGLRDAQEAINAARKGDAVSLAIFETESQRETETHVLFTQYGYRNHLRVFGYEPKGDGPEPDQIRGILELAMTPARRPVIVASDDGKFAGMAAAAYRLSVMKMPLDQVQRLAALPDAPAETTQAICEYAAKYDAAAKAAKLRPAKLPASAPASTAPATP